MANTQEVDQVVKVTDEGVVKYWASWTDRVDLSRTHTRQVKLTQKLGAPTQQKNNVTVRQKKIERQMVHRTSN